ncbi:MAG: hypothetical protein JSS41_11955 [Proteobacteria bacterium]|nr:hypothetical protein [Pseudomonadota bacterium]
MFIVAMAALAWQCLPSKLSTTRVPARVAYGAMASLDASLDDRQRLHANIHTHQHNLVQCSGQPPAAAIAASICFCNSSVRASAAITFW